MTQASMRPVLCVGVRTPFVKAGGDVKELPPQDLGAFAVNELLSAYPKVQDHVDEVIFGCVGQTSMAANIARVIQLYTRIPQHVPAYTVARNCSSGLDAVTHAIDHIRLGKSELVIAGGVESMTTYPMRLPMSFKHKMEPMMRAKTLWDKLATLSRLRLADIKPIHTLMEGLTDPVVHLIMGETAEVLAREYGISRNEQDTFAVASHHKAARGWESGFLAAEVRPLTNAISGKMITTDNGIRPDANVEKFGQLKPFFQSIGGSVTVGNSSQITDGAVAMIVASEAKAAYLGLPILAYLQDYAFAGCDSKRMGLGPVFATKRLLSQNHMTWKNIQALEINEAFAAQVLSCLKVMEAEKDHYGVPNRDTLNPHGGAIALGHPLGASGARLTLTMARFLHAQKYKHGIVSLCIGGGQGAALLMEAV